MPAVLPAPPSRGTPPTSSSHRLYGRQPPVLATGILTFGHGAAVSTPQSATEPFSPLSLSSNSFATTPVAASRGISPMASRPPSQYSLQYNPREWAGDGQVAVQRTSLNRPGRQGEDGLVSPPPPYSPPPTTTEFRDTLNISTGLVSAAANDSRSSSVDHTRRADDLHRSRIPSLAIASNAHLGHRSAIFSPPPPPPVLQGSRPSSRLETVRIASESALSYTNDIRRRTVGSVMPTNLAQASGASGGESSNAIKALDHPQHPEASRRAVSTGRMASFVDVYDVAALSDSRSSSRQRGWQPGMPLPGPPAEPPPSLTLRSQSVGDCKDGQTGKTKASLNRPGAPRLQLSRTKLGPVPPTPAGWIDEQAGPSKPSHTAPTTLRIETNNLDRAIPELKDWIPAPMISPNGIISSNTTGTGLSRSTARRDPLARGLRERRTMSRNTVEIDSADLSALSINTNPWADAMDSELSAVDKEASSIAPSAENEFQPLRHKVVSSYPRSSAIEDQLTTSTFRTTTTPPLSPLVTPGIKTRTGRPTIGQPTKSLPTPPSSQQAPMSAHSVVPSFHSSTSRSDEFEMDDFMIESTTRHLEFLRCERSAKTDLERLQIFSNYILSESYLRRQRYLTTFSSGEFDVRRLRESLFERLRPETGQTGHETASPLVSSDSSMRPDSIWWKDYRPALSPIASMSNDDVSSRGRTSSRWWESQTGSRGDGADNHIVRSKRESKYMGLSKEVLQFEDALVNTPSSIVNPSVEDDLSYPPEKADPDTFGYLDEHRPTPMPGHRHKHSATPSLLDISRFITLPPPYPRHYPAVNNNHPDLVEYRNAVRMLSDLGEIRARKSRHIISVEAMRTDHKRKSSEGRRLFKIQIQKQLEDSSITYAEAAEAEESFNLSQHQSERESLQAEFDTLQDVVIKPLHELLNERITRLNSSIGALQRELFSDAQYGDPDRPQEEGDEKPELLENLTQLKWLFETREQIHKVLFDLMSQRNENYKAIVVLPYQQAGNLQKVRTTTAFFAQDNKDRYSTFCAESLGRHEVFLQTIEDSMRRGIELQSSAFWDIAPDLVELLQKIPDDPRDFNGVLIPVHEYDENPSYQSHPLQYLYSLLQHAEKSTYQFIESQTNLHCLLHEVKNSVLFAKYRVIQGDEAKKGQDRAESAEDLAEAQSCEEASLTADLKQKVLTIEGQWLEALGSQLQNTRERVKISLMEDGGWDGIDQDEE